MSSCAGHWLCDMRRLQWCRLQLSSPCHCLSLIFKRLWWVDLFDLLSSNTPAGFLKAFCGSLELTEQRFLV